MSTIAIRPETSADETPVRSVIAAAFGGPAEADLMDSLRADGDLVLSLVAEVDNSVVGQAAFPRLTLDFDGRTIPVVGLAPLAVAPAFQRQGIGTALVREGVRGLKDRAEGLVFVLGEAEFYRRFGFDAGAAAGFASPYNGPHFQVLRLSVRAPTEGELRYPRAFTALR